VNNTDDKLSRNLSMAATNITYVGNNMDIYIAVAFPASIWLLISLLPQVLGHFSGLNQSVMLIGTWPKKGWMLLLGFFAFLGNETLVHSYSIVNAACLGGFAIQGPISILLMMVTAAVELLIVSLLISSTQTVFVKHAWNIREALSRENARKLLQDYENIRQGVGPFYLLAFAIHAPIMLCFAFWGQTYTWSVGTVLRSISTLSWSWFSLVHICLMSENCFNAIKDLLPSVRYIYAYISFFFVNAVVETKLHNEAPLR
jgi:hypothetical protein